VVLERFEARWHSRNTSSHRLSTSSGWDSGCARQTESETDLYRQLENNQVTKFYLKRFKAIYIFIHAY